MLDLSTPRTYKPIKNSRRPEFLAWLLSFCLVLFLFISPVGGFFRLGGIVLGSFFLVSAVVISLGNWQNRKLFLRLSKDNIRFFNGIKESSVGWDEIQRVEVFRGRFNDKINLVSESGRISFDIVGLEQLNRDKIPHYGFQEGEEILNLILDQTNLNEQKQNEAGYYYQKD
ncbi:MAG: hypothetical protein P8Y72_04360 [Anaerolineales bacterium]|jgi:hypothetical protein